MYKIIIELQYLIVWKKAKKSISPEIKGNIDFIV